MSFADFLKQPLPSKVVTESVDDEQLFDTNIDDTSSDMSNVYEDSDEELYDLDADTDNLFSSDMSNVYEDSDDEDDDEEDSDDEDDDEEDLEDLDISDIDDEELEDLEEELEDSEIDNIVGDVNSVDLSADEERNADDLMCVSATTELIKSELNTEERARFYESATDTKIAVYEGFLLESDIYQERENDVLTEAKMFNKTTVRFSKDDRKKQLYAVAVNVSARAHNDPDYAKYQKILKAKKIYKRKLEKKYHNEAIKRMKVYFNRLKTSKSPILSGIGKKISNDTK